MIIEHIILFLVSGFFLILLATVLVHMFFLVPYVPSRKRVIAKMIEMARLKPHETVYDLGCGDGRLLIAAEKKARVKTVGFEIAPLILLLAWIRKMLFRSTMKIHFKSLFSANLRRANVIFCYLIPNVMPKLSKKIKHECRKGTRIISNTFHIPGLKATKIFTRDPEKGLPTIYVYRV